jgi:topoisomerase-4 subunit A
MKEKGVSTLGGRKIWFDEDVMRLNVDARGIFLGEFSGEDQILVITKSGYFRTTNFDLSNHFADDVLIVEKFREDKIWSAAYFDAEQDYYYVKRFQIESSTKQVRFVGEHPESKLIRITEVEYPRLELKFGGKNKDRNPEIIEVAEFIGVKSYKARGKRLSNYEVKVIQELTPVEDEENRPESEEAKLPETEAKKPEEKKPEAKQSAAKAKKTEASISTPKAHKTSESKKPATRKEEKAAPKKTAPKKPGVSKQDPDDVPLEVVKPKEEKTEPGKDDHTDSGGQFTLEW